MRFLLTRKELDERLARADQARLALRRLTSDLLAFGKTVRWPKLDEEGRPVRS